MVHVIFILSMVADVQSIGIEFVCSFFLINWRAIRIHQLVEETALELLILERDIKIPQLINYLINYRLFFPSFYKIYLNLLTMQRYYGSKLSVKDAAELTTILQINDD